MEKEQYLEAKKIVTTINELSEIENTLIVYNYSIGIQRCSNDIFLIKLNNDGKIINLDRFQNLVQKFIKELKTQTTELIQHYENELKEL